MPPMIATALIIVAVVYAASTAILALIVWSERRDRWTKRDPKPPPEG